MAAVKAQGGREHQRYQAFRALSRTARLLIRNNAVRLGTRFCILAPDDATILTTNLGIMGLGEALGKSVAARNAASFATAVA